MDHSGNCGIIYLTKNRNFRQKIKTVSFFYDRCVITQATLITPDMQCQECDKIATKFYSIVNAIRAVPFRLLK